MCNSIFNDSSLIVWNFSNCSHMVPNKLDKLGRFQNSYRRYKSLTYSISPERSNHTIFMEKAKVVMYCIKVAYRNLAVHISLNPIGRSFQWQLRRLISTNLFEWSTNQTLFPAVFFPLNTRNTFDFSCHHLMKSCGFLHGCTSHAKFWSLLSQFLGYFSSFL